ncbi:MAG: hypothetical protein EBR52_07260, partial [Microbacteriaceae bacterium]|nr:hypothetical protein [Microbacteriaceae bacterium]
MRAHRFARSRCDITRRCLRRNGKFTTRGWTEFFPRHRGRHCVGATDARKPSGPPPTETKIAVLKKGDGAVVGENSDVTLQYSGFIWQTGEVFDSSWTRGSTATFNVNGVIAGFHDALVGQKVGSQIAVIIPPDQGYGANPPSGSSITADSTLFFVID